MAFAWRQWKWEILNNWKKITDSKIFHLWCELFLKLLNPQIPRDNTEESTNLHWGWNQSDTLKTEIRMVAFQCPEFERNKKLVVYLLQKQIWAGTYVAKTLVLFIDKSPGLKYHITACVVLLKSFFFPLFGLLPLFPSSSAQNRIKRLVKPPFASAVIVTFTAAIVGERWSLLFPVSPGYHFPFKSCAPMLSWGVNKQIKQSCNEHLYAHLYQRI